MWNVAGNARHIVDSLESAVYGVAHRCVDAVSINWRRDPAEHRRIPFSFRQTRIDRNLVIGKGKGARCSDAVRASGLATHPDAFPNWVSLAGALARCAPVLANLRRRPGSENPFATTTCDLAASCGPLRLSRRPLRIREPFAFGFALCSQWLSPGLGPFPRRFDRRGLCVPLWIRGPSALI